MSGRFFSWRTFGAVLAKEFIQMRRDKLTFAMMVGIPLMQLILFGYAIDMDPKNLPTAVLSADNSNFSRSFVTALENSGYFEITHRPATLTEAESLIIEGAVQFLVQIPEDFSRRLQRGETPQILLVADATDPAATSNALAALSGIQQTALRRDLGGSLAWLAPDDPPFELVVHRRYNPEGITQYNIVPGLIGMILTMTLVIITSLALTRETERGTMEALLAMPVRPGEVLAGKITPYILVGYVQVVLVLIASSYLFHIPVFGSLWLLAAVLVIFIVDTLAIGFMFSATARTQLHGIQMSIFFIIPSILLSGFMFPFRGMPVWAQWIGEVFPLTHFLRITRGIMLKGSGLADIGNEFWPMLAFLVVAVAVALHRYSTTLD